LKEKSNARKKTRISSMNVKINGFQGRKTATRGKKQLSGQIHRFGKGETDTLDKR